MTLTPASRTMTVSVAVGVGTQTGRRPAWSLPRRPRPPARRPDDRADSPINAEGRLDVYA